MSATLQNTGDFLVVQCEPGQRAYLRDELRDMTSPSSIAGAHTHPAIHDIGSHALVITWGSVTLLDDAGTCLVGVIQSNGQGSEYLAASLSRLNSIMANSSPDIESLHGANYALLIIDKASGRMAAVTDAFRRIPLYSAHRAAWTAFATDCRLLTVPGLLPPKVDAESIYHYLNYSYVPAPRTIFQGIRKIPAATVTTAGPENDVHEFRYWRPRFTGNNGLDEESLVREFRDRLFATVRAYRPNGGTSWGSFLSGGTDSSSIAGILATELSEAPVHTFSIGFAEPGYDELEYAEIAARRFGLTAHFRRVSEQDAVSAIPLLSRIFDEPYGNASAIPTLYCTREAADAGMRVLLAGDGGDESFGGNERYAKDVIYRSYARFPKGLRGWLARRASGSDAGSRFGNRVRNFLQRGAQDNPARFYSDDSFASDHFEDLLDPDFRKSISPGSSLELIDSVYRETDGIHELHRMMYVDLMMTIADNDITKVQRAAKAANISVAYPYLDPALVSWTAGLPAHWKVKGLKKRYLFKRAMKGLLPDEILNKKKQGFALPISDWLQREGIFNELINDSLRSRRFRERGIFEMPFVETLLTLHRRGTWDYSAELWRLFMLDAWMTEHADGR